MITLPAPAPAANAPPFCPTPRSGKKHTVVAGDTLQSIAAQYGTTPEALLKRNRKQVQSAEQIQPGMVLSVPKGSGSPPPHRPTAKQATALGGIMQAPLCWAWQHAAIFNPTGNQAKMKTAHASQAKCRQQPTNQSSMLVAAIGWGRSYLVRGNCKRACRKQSTN